VRSKVLAVAAAIFAACAWTSASAQIVDNGGFELPDISGTFQTIAPSDWTVTGSVDLINTYWQPHSGGQSLDLNGNDMGAISQDISLQTGQFYLLSFWISANPEGGPATKALTFGITNTIPLGTLPPNFTVFPTPPALPSQTLGDMNWEERQYLFQAQAGSHTLSFASLTAGAYGPALDDISITAVPEPEVYAMLLAGFGFLGFVARRRRVRRFA
jgi:choice-of-anchor C domain-containing protein